MLDSKDLELLRAMMQEVVTGAVSESEARMTAKMDELETRMTARIEERVEDTRFMLMAYFESAIEPKFNMLAEGHKLLQETLAPVSRVEKLEEEVSTLRSVVMLQGAEISELKKSR